MFPQDEILPPSQLIPSLYRGFCTAFALLSTCVSIASLFFIISPPSSDLYLSCHAIISHASPNTLCLPSYIFISRSCRMMSILFILFVCCMCLSYVFVWFIFFPLSLSKLKIFRLWSFCLFKQCLEQFHGYFVAP